MFPSIKTIATVLVAVFITAPILETSFTFLWYVVDQVLFYGWRVEEKRFCTRLRGLITFRNLGLVTFEKESNAFKERVKEELDAAFRPKANRAVKAGHRASELRHNPFRPYWFYYWRQFLADLRSSTRDNQFHYAHRLAERLIGKNNMPRIDNNPRAYASERVRERFS